MIDYQPMPHPIFSEIPADYNEGKKDTQGEGDKRE